MDGSEPEQPGVSSKVGPYRLEEQLGSGGMGEVYRAYDERLRRWVAIKQLLPEVAGYTDLRERFRREARAVAGLNHPAIVQVYDILEGVEGHDWIVMELVEGTLLKDMIAEGPLPPDRTIRLAVELAEGLAVAHSRGVVHRDLKIENVMVMPSEQVKILDFGLAKDYESGSDSSTLSSQGAVIGTVRSMSPEQVMGLAVDPRSDLFSLGTLLFESLTGESPFKAANTILTLARVCSYRQPPVKELNPNVPEALSELVDRLLEKDPGDRPQSAREVVSLLKEIGGVDSQPGTTAPLSGPGRPKSWDPQSLESTDGFYVKTLVQLSLVGRAKLSERLGEARAAEVLTRHDRLVRDLLAQFEGLEVEKGSEGFLLIFERPVEAVGYAVSYHDRLRVLSQEMGLGIEGRIAVHLGEVYLHENPASDVALGAKHLEVEGSSKLVAIRLLELTRPRQTLVTREAFEMAQRAQEELVVSDPQLLLWLSHGTFRLPGVGHRMAVFEVGRPGMAPLLRPRAPGGVWRWLTAAAVLALAVVAVFFSGYGDAPRFSVAVLGFRNLSNQEADLWLSTTLAELLSTELAVSGEIRLIPAEAVARMKRELKISEAEPLASDTLKAVGRNLGTDFVVVGSYYLSNGQIRFSPVLQSTRTGETVQTVSMDATETEIVQLISRAGADLRERLGGSRLSEAQMAAVRATLPQGPGASRFYSEGLMKLRSYDALGARDSLEKAVSADSGFALAHAALSEAWNALGYDKEARAASERAVELSKGLPREHQLLIEARSYEISRRFKEAISTYNVLWSFFPDDLEYGLRLANVRTRGGDLAAAAQTVEALRDLGLPASEDARIDMAEVAIHLKQGNYSAALAAATQAEAKGRRRQTGILVADALQKKGWTLRQLGKLQEAAQALEEARQLFGQAGDASREAQVINALSGLRASEGHHAEAEKLVRESLSIHRRTGNRVWILSTLNNLAIYLKMQGDYNEAVSHFSEAMELAREIGDEAKYFDLVQGLVGLRARQGRLAEGHELMEEVRGRPSERLELQAWRHLAEVELYLTAGELREAEEALRRAFAVDAEIELPSFSGELNRFAALHALAVGDLAAAEEKSLQAVRIYSEVHEPANLARGELILAQVEIAQGRLASAEETLARIRPDFERYGLVGERVEAEVALAKAFWLDKRPEAAWGTLARAVATAPTLENLRIRLQTEILAARISGDPESARDALREALGSAREAGLTGAELEARLALAEVLPDTPPEELRALVEDARKLGFGLIAERAQSLSRHGRANAQVPDEK